MPRPQSRPYSRIRALRASLPRARPAHPGDEASPRTGFSGPVGLEAALDLRDVDAELALARLEAVLAHREQVLAALDLLLAQLEVGLEDGPAGLEVPLALVQVAGALLQGALELGHPSLAPVEARARLRDRGRRAQRVLELPDALLPLRQLSLRCGQA